MNILDKLLGSKTLKKSCEFKCEFKKTVFGNQINILEKNSSEKSSRYDCIKYVKGCFSLKEYDNALFHCNFAIKCNTKDPAPYMIRGDIFLENGNDKAALLDWKKALQLMEAYWARSL